MPLVTNRRAEDSNGTASVSCEEGGDDVKSARPLHPGRHTCYNGVDKGQPPGDRAPIPKPRLSSDRSLQLDSVKLDSLVIAHQPWRGEYVPRTGRCGWNTSFLEREIPKKKKKGTSRGMKVKYLVLQVGYEKIEK